MGFSLIIAGLIILIAAFIRAVSGFGYSLISTPLLTFIFDAKTVVVMNMILGSATNLLVLYHTWRHIDFKRAGLISAGSILGVPIGAFLLSALDPSIIKLIIAALVIPFSIVLMLGYSYRFTHEHAVSVIVGFFSGILASSTSLGGPPAVLFLLNQGLAREKFVGTIGAFFLVITALSLSTYAKLGLINTDVLIKVGIFLPVLFIGSYAGVRMLPKINVTLFKRLTTSILIVTAVSIIVSIFVGK